MSIEFREYPPNYYGNINGIMLEAFPAMNEVLGRLASLPIDEQIAWGRMFQVWGSALIVRNELQDEGEKA